jgi:hypothetical protein
MAHKRKKIVISAGEEEELETEKHKKVIICMGKAVLLGAKKWV